jgi:hypothetical protein
MDDKQKQDLTLLLKELQATWQRFAMNSTLFLVDGDRAHGKRTRKLGSELIKNLAKWGRMSL